MGNSKVYLFVHKTVCFVL